MLHIHTAVGPEGDAFFQQPAFLVFKVRGGPACVIYHTVTGEIPVKLRHAQNPSDQTGILLPSDQPGDLSVGSDLPFRDLLHDGKDLPDQTFIKDRFS